MLCQRHVNKRDSLKLPPLIELNGCPFHIKLMEVIYAFYFRKCKANVTVGDPTSR